MRLRSNLASAPNDVLQMSLQEITKMSTIQIRVDDELKKNAYLAFEKLNLSPSDALRLKRVTGAG